MNDETDKLLEPIRGEYARYRRLCQLALDQVSDETFFAGDEDGNHSIAVIVQHMAGNLRSRFTDFLDTDGEKPWRERDSEFVEPAKDRAAVMRAWHEAWGIVDLALADVARRRAAFHDVTIRGEALSVMEALSRSVSHAAYHTGQVVWAARAAAGAEWRSLSIPKGESEAYNRNPTLERGPV